ncbi:DNA polymerase IV [Luteolibacter flavescens]|uniref:DNA polymerase IV n=1 Tax=Luteolibacter flavescens TaxID=1859460 RepID=A0ABT3FTK2_9BACT|nr:DNA polymerase IV [Luteolibacter flavescens]MCW1886862.1 DNA polymerase IV [Luteolibacter flavescens]
MRKIVHIDMDCFYAAIEERENPALRGKPVGVGGSTHRGVLTTANYEARKFGCRSAMPVFKALQLCPQLIIVPVRFDLYRSVSAHVRAIFGRFTEKIEPLSLDEAYLDLSHLNSSAESVAREIRTQIREELGLTASAGIGPNKLIAKIASDWNKPDGQHEIRPQEVNAFMHSLPVGKLWGVGGKMREKLERLGVKTCGDLQRFDKIEMSRRFGKWGLELWELSRGIDHREVETERIRKSISTENTFRENLTSLEDLRPPMHVMLDELTGDLVRHEDREIRSLVVKMKFADFTRTTAEKAHGILDTEIFGTLLEEAWQRGGGKPVRLLGVGVRFRDPEEKEQMELL